MQVNQINNCANNRYTTINFQKGLPHWFINETMRTSSSEVERQMIAKNLRVSFDNNSTVASCCKKTVEILENYGLILPKNFEIKPLKKGIRGFYENGTQTVTLNKDIFDKLNILKLNTYEEKNYRNKYQSSEHFLHSYLHEFLHAAHYNNIARIWGDKKANLIWNYMSEIKPNGYMLGFMNGLTNKFVDFMPIVKKIFPPTNGSYAQKDVSEYIVEKLTRLITLDLGNQLDLTKNNKFPLIHPEFYYNSVEKSMSKYYPSIIERTSEYDLSIWNGDLSNLSKLIK